MLLTEYIGKLVRIAEKYGELDCIVSDENGFYKMLEFDPTVGDYNQESWDFIDEDDTNKIGEEINAVCIN